MTLRPWLFACLFACSGHAANDAPIMVGLPPTAATSAPDTAPPSAAAMSAPDVLPQTASAGLPPPVAAKGAEHDAGLQSASIPSAGAAGSAMQSTVEQSAQCRAFVAAMDCEPPSDTALPRELRCTGLYADWNARELACNVRAYTPAFELWSDGAHKRRFVWLPAGSHIDARSPDALVYPVGTQFWKEFSLDGTSSDAPLLAETRLLRKTAGGWLYTSYVWSRDGRSATASDAGVRNLYGTGHDVPQRSNCHECHKGREDFILGWDMLLLGSGATGVTRELLQREGVLQEAPLDALASSVPGDDVERTALGYLHVNCGVSCRNANKRSAANDTGLQLRLEYGELASVQATAAVRTGINKTPKPAALGFVTGSPFALDAYYDLAPLDAARSFVVVRMGVRELLRQMPPLATNRVDKAGLQLVTAWIEHMTTSRGYPPAPP